MIIESRNKCNITNGSKALDNTLRVPTSSEESEESVSNDKIVRRSHSVVIHCNNANLQTIPDIQKSNGEYNKEKSCDIHENLEDIKYEIEKLIIERDSLLRENLLLGFYKECTDL